MRVEEMRRSQACRNLLSFCTSMDLLQLELHPGYHSVFSELIICLNLVLALFHLREFRSTECSSPGTGLE